MKSHYFLKLTICSATILRPDNTYSFIRIGPASSDANYKMVAHNNIKKITASVTSLKGDLSIGTNFYPP
jgi:hypothetical protein